jgi:hypothetical protein
MITVHKGAGSLPHPASHPRLPTDSFNIVADAGYSNGEQAAHCEAASMLPYVPVMRTVNNQGDGTSHLPLFKNEAFLITRKFVCNRYNEYTMA